MLRRTVKKAIKHLRANNYIPLNRIELARSKTLNNIDHIRSQNKKLGIIPVLKANAYGHGLSQMAEILNKAECSFVAIDGYFEAASIRDITKHHILVMGYIRPENVRLLDTKRCSFVIQDKEGLEAFARLGKPVKVHLELNTGMNRMGLQPEELDDYLNTLKQFPALKLEGVMSHLADADNEIDNSYSLEQTKLFDDLVKKILGKGFKPSFIHLAQTAGSTKTKSRFANAIRLGIGLYGLNPLNANDHAHSKLAALQPILEMKSTVIKVIELKKGDRVSYNGIFTAPKTMKIGVLPLGYYEGIPRVLSNSGTVLYRDKQLPIVGRVCMNHTMIDIDDADIKVGSEVTIISSDPDQPNAVNNICASHNLFNYSFVTGLASTTRRIIV